MREWLVRNVVAVVVNSADDGAVPGVIDVDAEGRESDAAFIMVGQKMAASFSLLMN